MWQVTHGRCFLKVMSKLCLLSICQGSHWPCLQGVVCMSVFLRRCSPREMYFLWFGSSNDHYLSSVMPCMCMVFVLSCVMVTLHVCCSWWQWSQLHERQGEEENPQAGWSDRARHCQGQVPRLASDPSESDGYYGILIWCIGHHILSSWSRRVLLFFLLPCGSKLMIVLTWP